MENEKCPVCQTGTLEDWNRKVRQCDACDFKCNTDDLPRIAAAMELAMAAYAARPGMVIIPEREMHVLEVFGGE